MATDPSSPLLEVRGISKQFSGVRALDDVSLTLARGEVLAIVGENGAGKSTLMRIVAGVEPPTAGEIVVDGEPVRVHVGRPSAQARHLAHPPGAQPGR